MKQLSGLEGTDEGKRAATATERCAVKGGSYEKKAHSQKGETMRLTKVSAIAINGLALLVVLGTAYQAMAQDATAPYPKMAPIEQYLMTDQGAEIALARSAAPESISRDAEILVLGRHGFETAV